ncbi:hypothetical protein IFM89_016684 [Coptis chinensis]|uniref:GH10 domain-containing protein n=1 Tax=Coptis chinensis TaxID=261450 RepID=A0A835M6M5_9MAGN|nr:hypothetical protein IFM89_016684 [Coptis chinensis]
MATNTIEFSYDILASPDKYIEKIRQIQAFKGNKDITEGIGLQSHFSSGPPNLPYMKASLDKLASTGLPIWLAEVDVAKHPNQPVEFHRMCLTDYDYKNTPVGDVVDKLIDEWKTRMVVATTDAEGYFETSLYLGRL